MANRLTVGIEGGFLWGRTILRVSGLFDSMM